MGSNFVLQFSFLLMLLLGGLFSLSLVGAQWTCNVTGVPAIPDLDLDRFVGTPWYLQEIIVRKAEDLEEPKHSCYKQATVGEFDTAFTVSDLWLNITTGESGFLFGCLGFADMLSVWHVYWREDYYTGVWVNTDYDNYAVQYHCPEEASPLHPESMLLFTRAHTPDQLTLELLEIVAEGHGFPRENGIRINNTDCLW